MAMLYALSRFYREKFLMSTIQQLPVCVTIWLIMTSLTVALTVRDLTYVHGAKSVAWPSNVKFNFTILSRGQHANGFWLETNAFTTHEHYSTHMDAPAHFCKGAWRVHEIPASRLAGPGVVIDVTDKAHVNADYEVSVDDLKMWEARYGRIPDSAVVLMNSGWGSRYPDMKQVFNSPGSSSFHFPGFHLDTARWLVENRNVTAVGSDTPSADRGQSKNFEVHQVLLKNNIMILENVANIDQLPPLGTTIVIGFMKLEDGSGAPMRLLAFDNFPNKCPDHASSTTMLILTYFLTSLSQRV